MESINVSSLPPGMSSGGLAANSAGLQAAGGPKGLLSFQDLLYQQLQDANGQYMRAQESVDTLLAGNLDNIHNVVLETAKAELSMQMMLEMRNRLTEQYQELMRMQI